MSILLCGVAHPCLGIDALAEADLQVMHQFLHHLLAGSREVALAIHLTESLAHRALDLVGSTLPKRIFLLAATHGLAEEVEVGLTDLVGEVRGRALDDIPLHEGTKLVGSLQSHEAVERCEEGGLSDIHLLDVVELHALSLSHLAERNVGIVILKLLQAHLVVVGLGITELGIALGSNGQLSLSTEDISGLGTGLCVGETVELEHAHEVLLVSITDVARCLVVVEIVVLLSQCQSTL